MASTKVPASLCGALPTRSVFSLFSLSDRVALVTGGLSKIGLEAALALAEAGATVYYIDLPDQPTYEWLRVQSYVEKLPDAHGISTGRLEYIPSDVTDQSSIWGVAQEIGGREGRLDICVCITERKKIGSGEYLELSEEDLDKITKVNVNSVLFSVQAAGREMKRMGIPGSIVVIESSTTGDEIPPSRLIGKGEVSRLTAAMALEMGQYGIRVNSLQCGLMDLMVSQVSLGSPSDIHREGVVQNALGRMGRLDELRGALLWLSSDASAFCTGSDIVMNGGHFM